MTVTRAQIRGMQLLVDSLATRTLRTLPTIAAAIRDADSYPSGGGDGRGGSDLTPVERAVEARLGKRQGDKWTGPTDDLRTVIEAITTISATAHATIALCDRYIAVSPPQRCVGGVGTDWWSRRRTQGDKCTNWAAVNESGAVNRGGLCDACNKARQRHEKDAA